MTHLFTYGSLMFEPVWQAIVTGKYSASQASLAGFKRRAVKYEDYPVILPGAADDCVDGALYRNVSGYDLALLDKFEGVYYLRKPVIVDCDGIEIPAEAYVLKQRYYAIASARPWDVKGFERVGIQRFLKRYRGFR